MPIFSSKNKFSPIASSDIFPLARHIRRVLRRAPRPRAFKTRFLTELEDHFSEEETERILTHHHRLGRYAELFAYYDNEALLS